MTTAKENDKNAAIPPQKPKKKRKKQGKMDKMK